MMEPDVESFRGPEIDLRKLVSQPSIRPPRHRAARPFLKGPIPWDWLAAAMRLPGRSVHVALLLWREAGCTRRRTVRFRLAGAKAYGIHADAAKRGLRALQAAGLVTVTHHPGRALEVTLMDRDDTTRGAADDAR